MSLCGSSTREDGSGDDRRSDRASNNLEGKAHLLNAAGEHHEITPVYHGRNRDGATRWRNRPRGDEREPVRIRPPNRHRSRTGCDAGDSDDRAGWAVRHRQLCWQRAAVGSCGQRRQAESCDHNCNKSKGHAVADGTRERLVPDDECDSRNRQQEERRPGVASRGVANAHSPNA